MQRALSDINDVVERCAQADLVAGNRLQAQPEPLDLQAELQRIAAAWRWPQTLSLQLEVPAQRPDEHATVVQTDPQLLRIVLANLLDNARKYGQRHSPITVRLAVADATQPAGLVLEVANVPGEAHWPDPAQLFRRYYRSPNAQRQTGAGLGLYLVHDLMQVIGARIAYVPSDTQVCFRLWLPR